jgi:hypothetical protein
MVYVLPWSQSFQELRNRINRAVETITSEMLLGVSGIRLLHLCVPGKERCAHGGILVDAHEYGQLSFRLTHKRI